MNPLSPDHPLRGARWIWPADCPHPHNTYAQFRRDFVLDRVPRRAPLFVTADQSYQLWVNGRYVGRGPARGFQATWAYDEHDIAPFLRAGRNWISALVHAGGISTFGYLFEWHAGLLLAARLGRQRLVSDTAWSSRVSPAYRADTVRMSVQTNLQEQFDAARDDGAWISAARPTRGWPRRADGRPATDARPFGCQPWYAPEPRGIPNLTRDGVAYGRAVSAAAGPCAPGCADTPNAAVPLRQEIERLAWTKDAPPVRRAGEWTVLDVPAAGRGRLRMVVLDLGRPCVGTLRIECEGAAGGEVLDLHGSETVEPDGRPTLPAAPGKPPAIAMVWRIGLRAGRTRHEFHQMIGHRFLLVAARGSTRSLRLRLSLRETRYPLEVRGRFRSSDALLNDIHRICVRTQEVCMLDAYVDTPWREQAQWWGDARVQAGNTFHLADDPRLLARGVRILARQGVPNGLTYGHAPTNCHGGVIPDFTQTWMLTAWDHFWQTGSTALATEQWPRLMEALGYFAGEGRGDHGLLRHDERYWLFLDWADLHKAGTPTLLNLWHVAVLDALRDLARRLGRDGDAARLDALRDEHVARVNDHLWDAEAGLFHDGLTKRGRPVRTHSVHNQALAILAGLRPEAWPTLVRERLLPYLRDEKVPGAKPSSYWVGYVYGVLNRLGYGADVVRHIRRHYAPMVPSGGTRENWNGGSHSHAWAAHPIQHLAASLGGLRQAAPAWSRVEFAPVVSMTEISSAETVIPTPAGDLRSSWTRSRSGVVRLRLRLPDGVEAHCRLPGGGECVRTGGAHAWRIRLRNDGAVG